MTTIAYKNGVLAVDGLATYGQTPESVRAEKVIKAKDGRLFAICGDFGTTHAYAKMLASGTTPNPLPKDAGKVIEVRGRRSVIVHDAGGSYPLKAKEWSYGSGSDAARGAMMAGADAKKAVQIACKLDVHSGGIVRTFQVKK